MSSSWSTCPGCHQDQIEGGPAGYSSRGWSLPPWAKDFVCLRCNQQPWFECIHASCTIPSHKNLFYTTRQLRNHAQNWHAGVNRSLLNSLSNQPVDEEENDNQEFSSSPDIPDDISEFNSTHDIVDLSLSEDSFKFIFATKSMAQFAEWCIEGSVAQATHCLVQESLFQAPVSLYLDHSASLPNHVIKLFLKLATLLIGTGETQHILLADILHLLIGLIPPDLKEWPTMPTTLQGFKSHVLNPTNRHALVSILPTPTVIMLSDDAHAYCCLTEIAAYVLLFPRTLGTPPIPLRLRQLCQSSMVQSLLLETPATQSTRCLVTLGLLFWLDGWDPSASSKNNRSPVHTASATLLCIDNLTGKPFNSRTFPIACGPGKADHNSIFESLRISLDKLSHGKDIIWSHHHGQWTSIQVQVIAFLMDQPERRGSNSLLGGNSKQHAMFGVSCNFENLALPFSACPKCLATVTRYLNSGNFALQPQLECRLCYGFSMDRLMQLGKYKIDHYSKLSGDAPGYQLATNPGTLTFDLLLDAWSYAIRRFLFDKQWSKEEVLDYFTMLCINKTTIARFTLCCCNVLLLNSLKESPNNFDAQMVAYVEKDQMRFPLLYQIPAPPAAWSICTINQRVETIRHLSMNTQKAVFRLILKWAADLDQGPALKKFVEPLIDSVHILRVPFVPCCMFKTEKCGGCRLVPTLLFGYVKTF